MENATSADVKGWPSCHFTPCLSVNVISLPSTLVCSPVASDGRILLEGPQTFYFEDGAPQWTLQFHLGRKIGDEIFYRADGSKAWQKTYSTDDAWTWQLFDAAGKQTAESHWHGKTLVDYNFDEAKQ